MYLKAAVIIESRQDVILVYSRFQQIYSQVRPLIYSFFLHISVLINNFLFTSHDISMASSMAILRLNQVINIHLLSRLC